MRFSVFLGLLLMVALFVGCGGDDGPSKPNVAVSISPATTRVQVGRTKQFTVLVTGTTDQTVTWTVDGGDTNGTIGSSGLYTAPATVPTPPTTTVRATSNADVTKSGTAGVTIAPVPIVVTIDPVSATVKVGETQQFTAAVTGTANTAVTWSVDGEAANGTIDASGLYTAPAVVPDPETATVVATSMADPTASGTAGVAITGSGLASLTFVRVPAGSFTMGDGNSGSYCGSTQYPVTLTEDFYLGQTEVTNQQYLELVQWAFDHGYVTATSTSMLDAMGSTVELLVLSGQGCEIAFSGGVFSLRDAGYGINPDHPVKQVTWHGAAAFCDWMSLKEGLPQAHEHSTWRCNGLDPYRAQGYRLPTDAEWEYAAQYDDERTYPWGNEAPNCDRTNSLGCDDWTDPVRSHPAEKTISGRGLYDMGGNLWEWCNDWHRCAAAPSPTDPPGFPFGTYRVLRGGSYSVASSNTSFLRCAFRYYYDPVPFGSFLYRIGFRVARTVNP